MPGKVWCAGFVGFVLLLPAALANAGGMPGVESTISSDGSWTAFTFPSAIPEAAKVKVIEAKCDKPQTEKVDFVLVPKGKCQGAAGSARPKGAKHPDKLVGTLYKLSEQELCAGTASQELKCTLYADTEW